MLRWRARSFFSLPSVSRGLAPRAVGVSSLASPLANQPRSTLAGAVDHPISDSTNGIGPGSFPKSTLEPSPQHPHVVGLSPSTRSLFFLYYLLSPITTSAALASRYPFPITASSILSLYNYSEELSNTIPLGPDELSQLIHICGSLVSNSFLPPAPTSIPTHQFIDSAIVKLDVSWGDLARFISKLLQAKVLHGEPVTDNDRYWCLRACVAWLGTATPNDAEVAAALASEQYLALSHYNDFEIHRLAILALLQMNDVHLTSIACRNFCEVIEDMSLDGAMLIDLARKCIMATGGEVWVSRIAQMWRQRTLVYDVVDHSGPKERPPPSLSTKTLAEMFRSALSGSLERTFPNLPRDMTGWIYSEVLRAITLPTSSSSGCLHSDAVSKNFKMLVSLPTESSSVAEQEFGIPSLSPWRIVAELDWLEEDPLRLDSQPDDILLIHDRWSRLSRQEVLPSAVDRAVTLSFVRLAGRCGDTRLLGQLATSVMTTRLQPTDSLTSTNPLLNGGKANLHPNHDHLCLAVEWAVAEASISRVQWDTLLQSLRNVKLLHHRTPNHSVLSTFASILVHRLSEDHLHQAFDLHRTASSIDISLPPQTARHLCDLAICQNSFEIAIELMESSLSPCEGNASIGHDDDGEFVVLLGKAVKAISRSGVVSLPENVAKSWSHILTHFFPKFAVSLSTNPDHRHWEWQLLVLVRSRQYQSAVDILSSITKSFHFLSEDTLHQIIQSLCQAQQFRLAMTVRESLSTNLSYRPFSRAFRFSPLFKQSNLLLDVDRFIYRSVAKAGMDGLVEEMWAKLVDGRRYSDGTPYTPDKYERILRHYGKRRQWLRGGDVPQSLFKGKNDHDDRTIHLRAKSMAIAERKKTGEKIILNKLLATNERSPASVPVNKTVKPKRPPIRRGTHPNKPQSEAASSTVALNALLNAALTTPRHESHSRIQTVRRVFHKFQQLVVNHDQRHTPVRPDRITFNTLIKGLLNIPSLSPATIRWLFDVLIQCGYPTGTIRLTGQPGRGQVFGTTQHPDDGGGLFSSLGVPPLAEPVSTVSPSTTSSSLADVELLQRRSVVLNTAHNIHHQPISFRHHTEPLYKMFIKAFYRRADIESARRVLYIYKSVKDAYLLDVERQQSERWVAAVEDDEGNPTNLV